MGVLNVFQPITSLLKAPQIYSGGMCTPIFFKKEDVLAWPDMDPQTGIISSAVQLKPGKSFYLCAAVEKDRTFLEELKYGPEGPYMDISVSGTLAGNTAQNILSAQAMQFSEYGLIVPDRDGNKRLIGNEDSCARFVHSYSSADITTSRKRTLKWSWQNSLPAPIYEAQAFQISVGGIIVTAGTLTLITRFKVGRPGAPMINGGTVYINNGLANKNILVLANGTGLPCDDGSGQIDWTGSIERHIEKTFASNQITFVGGVVQDEIIEIYAFS
jgi:hypothetical protein